MKCEPAPNRLLLFPPEVYSLVLLSSRPLYLKIKKKV